MGQVASLFGITEAVFRRIEVQPESFNYAVDSIAVEGFSKTFEGLRYVLTKMCKPAIRELVAQLFEPESFIGNMPDYANLDWENMPDDFPLEGNSISYHDPRLVATLGNFLSHVTEQDFALNFSADELNEQQVYPYDIWNESADENNGFNRLNMVREFSNLKKFFAQITDSNSYCIVVVG